MTAEDVARDALRKAGVPDDEITGELLRFMAERVDLPGRRTELVYEIDEEGTPGEPAPDMPRDENGRPRGRP